MGKRFDEQLERLLWAIGRQSERFVFALAAVLYLGVGLAVPVFFKWTTSWFVFANVFGVTWAGVAILMWLANGAQAKSRRQLLEWTTELRHLNSSEFEWLVGEIFRREGWTVVETGRPDGPDGNVDLRLRRDGNSILVQCKRWTSRQVGVDEIRALAGTAVREGLRAADAMFVTMSDYTGQARQEAKQLGITLVDGADLFLRMERARAPQPCPICSRAMRLDQSDFGWWFRCLAPGCKGKRDLGRDPARVVGLLVQEPD
jgi:hypothetical protein